MFGTILLVIASVLAAKVVLEVVANLTGCCKYDGGPVVPSTGKHWKG